MIVPDDRSGWEAAADALLAGKLVALPTDTVYGLAALAADRDATTSIFAAKGRPDRLELPVLVSSAEQALAVIGPVRVRPSSLHSKYAGTVLMERFWPGPLTLIFERARGVDWNLGGDSSSIGLRAPAHAGVRDLCSVVGPIATTSANRHREPPCRTAGSVVASLGSNVAVTVDGGELGGEPSTVVDVREATIKILREGALAEALISAAMREASA